jgi:protein-S-isoprenylcysteine O-methyltransferase Ste14
MAIWLSFELALFVRERRRGRTRNSDRGTAIGLVLGVSAGIVLSALFGRHSRRGQAHLRLAVAAALVAVGAALRMWSARTLGAHFRLIVAVSDQHELIVRGPYRLVRHPSYTGLLLALVGVGVANGSALSVLVCILAPLPAVVWRIRVEEAALTSAFGASYRDYSRRTHKLIPGIW